MDIPDKTPESIIDALTTHWLQLHGKPELMIWDGERAMISGYALQWASQCTFQLTSRAKHSKAWVAERRKEILRNALHKCQTQLAIEGHDIKCSHVLADGVISKNALLSIDEGTPYVALYGRVPSLLPQIEHIVGTARSHWLVLIALLYIAQNIVKIPMS